MFLSDLTDFHEVMELPPMKLDDYKNELLGINIETGKKPFEPQDACPVKLKLLDDAFGERIAESNSNSSSGKNSLEKNANKHEYEEEKKHN